MNRTAGYSHHWAIHREFTPSEWSRIVLEAARIVQKAKEAGIRLGDESGHGSPTLNRQVIVLNGAPPNDHETFYLQQTPDKHELEMYQKFVEWAGGDSDGTAIARGFCKTNDKPYDAVVVSILAVAQKVAPDAITVTSDGGTGAIRRVFGSQPISPATMTPPRKANMSDKVLRSHLIRLAHQHPEFRKDLLPLVTACAAEGPMMGKFEEGKPADPTENMTPEAKKEWEQNTDKYKDKFKGASSDAVLRARLIRLASEQPEFRKDLLPLIKSAGCEKLPEGGMRDNCEKKKEEGAKAKGEGEEKKEATLKQGGSVMHRATIGIRVRTTRVAPGQADGYLDVDGVMVMTTGVEDVAPLKFEASILDVGAGMYDVVSFAPLRAVSGSGAEGLLSFYKEMFQTILATNARQLLGSEAAL